MEWMPSLDRLFAALSPRLVLAEVHASRRSNDIRFRTKDALVFLKVGLNRHTHSFQTSLPRELRLAYDGISDARSNSYNVMYHWIAHLNAVNFGSGNDRFGEFRISDQSRADPTNHIASLSSQTL